nr:MAG TPA: CpXC protein [Caudoviricetes sp.]
MALIHCPNCGHPVSDKAEKCPECNQTLRQEPKPVQNKKLKRTLIIVVAAAVCIIAVALFLLARPAMAVSSAISALKGSDIPSWQEVQSAKEQYEALSGLQKCFVGNAALLEQKYEARKSADCTKKADQIASAIRAGGIGCKATYENDVLRIVEDFNVDYSLVMLNASTIVGPNIASASGTAKRGLEDMGYPEVSVIIEARVSGIVICTAKDGSLTS